MKAGVQVILPSVLS